MSEPATKDQLIDLVMEWAFMSDTGIAARIEEFAGSYCAYFEYIAEPSLDESAENRLVYTQIYQTFQQLFETELSNFLGQYGWTSDQFVATCQSELEKEDDNDRWGSVFEIIVSLTDYNIFKTMMLDMKRRHPTLEPPPQQ
jgi:ATP-dependent helicase/DNAse subunit B